jgi:hypothetical protein
MMTKKTTFSEKKSDLQFEITILTSQLLHVTNALLDVSKFPLSEIKQQKQNYRDISKELVQLATKLDDLIEKEFRLP